MREYGTSKKGQASIETLTLLGFVVLFSIPLIAVLGSINSDDAAIGQAKTTIQVLSDAANTVYIQGNGAQKVVLVAYPDNLLNAAVSSSGGSGEIVFTVRTQSGDVDVVGMTIAPFSTSTLYDNARKEGGLQRVKVWNSNGLINIGLVG